jgi:mono/diheme cytochrome c family protein
MAATDQTYRDQRTLDVIFGVSCGALLLVTIWMLVADYNRDFKAVQRKFRDVESTLAERDAVNSLPDPQSAERAMKLLRLAKRKREVGGARDILGDEEFEKTFKEWRDPNAGYSERLAAQSKLDGAQADFKAREAKLRAKREAADDRYRGIKADYDAQMSYYNIARDEVVKEEGNRQKAAEKHADYIQNKLNTLKTELDAAEVARDGVDAEIKEQVTDVLAPMDREVEKRNDELKQLTGAFDRFAKQAVQKGWQVGDTIRALPILDGFASPTKINQVWLPDLTIDYGGFKDVPRYDRCTTCHLGIDRTAYSREALASLGDTHKSKELTTRLQDAQKLLVDRQKAGEDLGFDPNAMPGERSGSIWLVFWLLLASSVVGAGTLGALERSRAVATNTFLIGLGITAVTAGGMWLFAPVVPKVADLKLSKGEITQFCAHPRQELFVDSNSAHPVQKFGCTICHAGQGSATDFQLSSHTPDTAAQKEEWQKEHGWASSHFWDFPMLSKRFVESSCLKCHHEVTDLITHGSKEEAPKLLRGYNLVKELGCFGCHEIAGQKGGRAVGPDLRLEPSPALDLLTAADQEKAKADAANPPGTLRKVGPSLRRLAEKTNEDWTRRWVNSPRSFRPDTRMPHFYGLSNNSPEKLPEKQQKFPDVEVRAITHYLMTESRKALDGKSDFTREALTTRGILPLQDKLFKQGLSEREAKDLAGLSKRYHDLALLAAPGNAAQINDLARRHLKLQEDLVKEIKLGTGAPKGSKQVADLKAVMKDLQKASQPARLIKGETINLIDGEGRPVKMPKVAGDKVRGRMLFTERGCLACHAHQGTTKKADELVVKVAGVDTPMPVSPVDSKATFGPELSKIHQKIPNTEDGRAWLLQWIMNPNVHHPRTRMPITHLSVAQANDVVAWLMSPTDREYKGAAPGEVKPQDVRDLARVYLAKAPGMTPAELDEVLPETGELKNAGFAKAKLEAMPRDADEQVLASGKVNEDVLTWYVGRKAIGRQGCYACHDVPGFETAKPIGTGLNDWGKKDAERLAFEDGAAWAEEHFHRVPGQELRAPIEARIKALKDIEENERTPAQKEELAKLEETLKNSTFFGPKDGKPPIEKIFFESLEHHQREGFLNLKLMEPRSFDHNRIKTWDDRLRMPQFQFSRARKRGDEGQGEFEARAALEEAEAREAVMTFILGLVADPIPLKYVYAPKPDRAAEVKGRQVLDKFNCAGCHQVRPGVYELPKSLAMDGLERTWKKAVGKDGSGLAQDHIFPDHNAWVGVAPVGETVRVFGYIDRLQSESAESPEKKAEDILFLTEAVRYVSSDGQIKDIPAAAQLFLPKGQYAAHAPFGGTFTELLTGDPAKPYPGKLGSNYLAKLGAARPFKDETAMRSSLPPPLLREGERVQPDWLYRFLLNPGPVRPESFMLLRMPKFNMSPTESRALVNYFAAVSKMENPAAGITFPYVTIPQKDEEYWSRLNKEYPPILARWAAGKEGQPSAEALKALEILAVDKAPEKAEAAKKAQATLKDLKDRQAAAKKLQDDLKKAKGTHAEAYARSSFALMTDKNLCVTCHNIGEKTKIESEQGPNLMLTADRLRPEWVERWIAKPARMFPYAPLMPNNFQNSRDPVQWQHTHLFAGTPIQQTRAVRDLLMDRRRLADLLSDYTPPKTTPPDKGPK